MAALGLLLVNTAGSLWFGFLCLCVISALGAFVGPAAQAGIPNLVDDAAELKQASVLFGSLWGAMLAIGAAIGGVFAAAFGRDAAFVANAVSFVIAAVAVSLITRPDAGAPATPTDPGTGSAPSPTCARRSARPDGTR